MRTKKTTVNSKNQIYSQLNKVFYSDLDNNNLLYIKIVRSTVSEGIIKNISIKNLPKNYYFFTADDFGENNYIQTLDVNFPILAKSEIHYKGEPVAIIAGEDLNILEKLSQLVELEIQKIALNHSKETPYAQRIIKNGKAKKNEEFTKLFNKKNHDVKGSWTEVLNAQSLSEPNGAFCEIEKGILNIYTPTLWPTHLQENLCRVLNLKKEEICIKKTESNSPHTNNIWYNTILAIITSFVTIKTKKASKLVLSCDEHIRYMTHKSPITIKIRTSVKKDGLIEANQILIEFDSGYNNPFASEYLDRLVIACNNIYIFKNFEIIAKAYESNNAPVSFNIESIDSQVFFAIENQINKIAKVTGLSPVEIRIKNFSKKLSIPFTFNIENKEEIFNTLEKTSDLKRKYYAYSLESKNKNLQTANKSNIPLRGVGISCAFNGVGYYGTNIFKNTQKIKTTLEKDGTFTINALPPSSSTLEIWKKKVNELLDIDTKQIKLINDYDFNKELNIPESVNSNLSVMNHLLQKCCLDIQSKRFRKPLPITSIKGLTQKQLKSWNKEKFTGIPFFALSFATCFVEIEIDPIIYKIKIKKILVIIDAGKIELPEVAQTSIKHSIEHTLTELVFAQSLECNNIYISFMHSENSPIQLDGLISKVLPAAFTSALTMAISKEINTIPIQTDKLFKEIASNEDTSNNKR